MRITGEKSGKEFLTPRVDTGMSGGAWAGYSFLGLLVFSEVAAGFRLLREDNPGAAAFCVLFLVLTLLPFYRKLTGILMSRQAVKVSDALRHVLVNDLDRGEFIRVMHDEHAVDTLKKLITRGFLQDVAYDEMTQRVFFPKRRFKKRKLFAFACASCGGAGTLEPFQKRVCPYCGCGLE